MHSVQKQEIGVNVVPLEMHALPGAFGNKAQVEYKLLLPLKQLNKGAGKWRD
jgi:hypothetical protein